MRFRPFTLDAKPVHKPGLPGLSTTLSILLGLVCLPSSLMAQSTISADGVIESKSGGFKFPDGTVTDNLTGLIWLKLADCFGERTWEQALSDANTLTAGFCGLTDGSVATDWRLPNIKELLSLADYGHAVPALPMGHPFTSVQSSFYWSSSSVVTGPDSAWVVVMSGGRVVSNLKGDPVNFVWPVRGGQ